MEKGRLTPMKSTMRLLVTSLAATALLSPAATVQAQVEPLSNSSLSVDQLRSSFTAAGFQTEPTQNWDWMSPPVSTFRVRDALTGRVVTALVYASPGAAEKARVQAEARQPSAAPTSLSGPQLIAGFGPSSWRANLALVQTTTAELERIAQAQSDCDSGVSTETAWATESAPTHAVDRDFEAALDTRAVAL